MKIYISGPISGIPEDRVREVFAQAEKQIEAFGHEPVNPLNNGLDASATWEEHMARDVYMLLGCDAIYLLKNWGNSQGARIEANIATERGMEVIHQPEYATHESKL